MQRDALAGNATTLTLLLRGPGYRRDSFPAIGLLMLMRLFVFCLVLLVGVPVSSLGVLIACTPDSASVGNLDLIRRHEVDTMLAELRPPKRKRPLIAVIGINDATETTDYLMPTGILRRANVADVEMLATQPGPVKLFPALAVEPDATTADFDKRHPAGADYVIVPAMSRDDDPTALAWIQSQAAKGATIVGICAGAKIVAAAGLLDGKRATTHWYYLRELLRRNPSIRYVPDRRIVVDHGVATTTGITASIPMMLTLIEAIAGRPKAEAVAVELGVLQWDASHDSGAFGMSRHFLITVLRNFLAFWRHEQFLIALNVGVDEVSLAIAADAWSRTYRSSVVTYGLAEGAVLSANGVRILPDKVAKRLPPVRALLAIGGDTPVEVLRGTLRKIAARHGESTSSVVSMQLEYSRQPDQ